ncbi:MAG TPA: PIN domain-containing protein [Candidatus Limnocylindria bacterium]|nr:PIN domain-containing protein [Candidatus Limnocylindria bacterium]
MKRFIQLIGALLGAMLGFGVGLWLLAQGGDVIAPPNRPAFLTAFVVALLLFGYLSIPYVTTYPARRFADLLAEAEAAEFALGVIGVIAGLIMGLLLGVPLAQLAPPWGELLPPIAAVALAAFVGWAFVYRRSVLAPALAGVLPGGRRSGPTEVIVDTSAVIDGRIVDIARTGFIVGTLVVPRFILDELQRIADSSDALRRNRGRRGLEMLTALQKDGVTPVNVVEETYPDIGEVDAKLIAMARDRPAAILTNDFNLNRVAELQGIRVLNINELANAVKVVVHPGEEMTVRIIQEGKEPGQGIGYLDDGTMIVVEGGIRFKDREIRITVTRVLQTVAGRMIFAQPRQDAA